MKYLIWTRKIIGRRMNIIIQWLRNRWRDGNRSQIDVPNFKMPRYDTVFSLVRLGNNLSWWYRNWIVADESSELRITAISRVVVVGTMSMAKIRFTSVGETAVFQWRLDRRNSNRHNLAIFFYPFVVVETRWTAQQSFLIP
jgi:hypothetical protein